jgi:hypothetical protein
MDDTKKALVGKMLKAVNGHSVVIIVADEATKEQIQEIVDKAKEKGLEIFVEKNAEEVAQKRFDLAFEISAENMGKFITEAQFKEELKKSQELLEEELKKQCYLKPRDPFELQRRREQREQMNQRSRFLSKNCKK